MKSPSAPPVPRWSSSSSLWRPPERGADDKQRHSSLHADALPPQETRLNAEISHQERVRRRVKEQRLRAMSPWDHQPRDLWGFPLENAPSYLAWHAAWSAGQHERQARFEKGLREGRLAPGEGVPANARAWVWRHKAAGGRVYEAVRGKEPGAMERMEIAKDVSRTFNASAELQEQLSRVLLAFSHVHPKSYTQGMSLVLAGLLAVLEGDEGIAFDLLTVVREQLLCGYYCPSMAGVRADVALLGELLRSKTGLAVQPARLLLVWSRWALPLFLDSLPSEACFQVWDLLFERGSAALFAVGMALVSRFAELLQSEQLDDVAVCVAIDVEMAEMYDVASVIALALEFLEDGDLDSTRLNLVRSLRHGEPFAGSRFTFPAPENAAPESSSTPRSSGSNKASPSASAPSLATSPPAGFFTSIASFLSRATSPPGATAPAAAPATVVAVPARVCAFCECVSESMNLYKWASLGESVARPICAPCFDKLKCRVCLKHRPDVVEELCGGCDTTRASLRPRAGTINTFAEK